MANVALIASYAKDDPLLRLASFLREHGWELLGTPGTAKFLSENGIPCREVGETVGRPILGHRVTTLAKRIYAALLASSKEDFAELDRMNIRPINLVYVTLYPIEEAIRNPDASPAEINERTDIGGTTLLRAAAKGRRLVISDPSQIDAVLAWMEGGYRESESAALVAALVAAAERRVATYTEATAAYWEAQARTFQ